jgi:hypothetical protein
MNITYCPIGEHCLTPWVMILNCPNIIFSHVNIFWHANNNFLKCVATFLAHEQFFLTRKHFNLNYTNIF